MRWVSDIHDERARAAKRRRILKRVASWCVLAVFPVCGLAALIVWAPAAAVVLAQTVATVAAIVLLFVAAILIVAAVDWAWHNK